MKLSIIFLIMLLIGCIINQVKDITSAKELFLQYYNKTWYGVMDGCGSYNTTTKQTEPSTINITQEGTNYNIIITHSCGMNPAIITENYIININGAITKK